jgi:rhamnulose-1-phosphate aldolase
MVDAPYPELDDLLRAIGEAGRRVADIEASEGAAGNLSVCIRWALEPRTRFPMVEELELPRRRRARRLPDRQRLRPAPARDHR